MKRSTTSIWVRVLTLAALLLASAGAPAALPAPPQDSQQSADAENDRDVLRISTWRFNSIAEGATDARDFETNAAGLSGELAGLEEIENARELYARMSFPEIELAVKKNRMSPEAARALGEGRRRMIRESLVAAAGSLPPNLRVGALDSGNKESGSASDIDQTTFLWDSDTGELATAEQIDGFIRAFDADFFDRNGFTPEHAGIESINGARFFPDWRLAKDRATFDAEARRVVIDKRANPELYRSEGQLKSQAEGRGYAALQEFGSQLERLDQDVAKADAEVARLADGGDATQLALARDQAANARQRRAELGRLSPWTEIVRGPDGTLEAVTDRDPRGKVLSVEPEMAERFSFDGSYDNWFMYEHHPDNRPKYLLRSVAEGAGLRSRLVRDTAQAVYDLSEDRRVVAFDYDVEYYSGNTELTDQFVRDVYGHLENRDGRMKVAEAKRALDTAARFRLRHKQKLKPDGTPYTEADVWRDYMPEADPNTPEATRIEIAKARWELDARELMIDNLMATVQDPSQIVDGPFDAAEFRRIVERVRQQDPNATPRPEDLRYAAELQLFHGFRDLMSPDDMRALAAWDGEDVTRPRLTGLVGRMIADGERVGGDRRRQLLERIAREAAVERIIAEAPPTVLEQAQAAVDVLRSRMESTRATYDGVLQSYQRGVYTPDYVARSLADGASRRFASGIGDALGDLGFLGEIRYLRPDGDGRIPAFEVEWGQPRFSSRRLLTNMMSSGNVDSVLQIYETYLDQGAAAAAARAAQELVMQMPRAGELTAAYQLLVEGDPEPAIQTGTVLLIPGAGQAYALVSIATTSVRIAGKIVLDPLRDDKLDSIYQGYLPAESAGILNAGRRELARSQLSSLLAPVRVRVIPHTPTDETGQPMRDEDGASVTVWVTGPYSDEEAWRLEFVDSVEAQEDARASSALGGGPEWEELLDRANDPVRYPELHFDARRASLFYHYEQRVDEFIRELGHADVVDLETLIALRGIQQAQLDLLPFFTRVVSHWVFDRDEFAPFDSGGYNQVVFDTLAAADRVEERQQNYHRLGLRMVGDFLRSYQLLRAADASIESGVRRDVEKTLAALARFRANALAVAMEEAHEAALQPELANAIHEEILDRRHRRGTSRIKVRPRVVQAASRDGAPADAEGDAVDVLVSVTASPEEHPRPWAIEPPEYLVTPGDTDADLAVRVTVRDANGAVIGEPAEVEVGTLAADEDPPRDRVLADRNLVTCALGDEMPDDAPAHETFEHCYEPDGSPLTIWDRVAVYFTPARDFRDPTRVEDMFVWRIVNPNGDEVVKGSYFEQGEFTTKATVRVPGDAPAAFAARLPARRGNDEANPSEARIGPGTYTVQTADARASESSNALFGTVPFSIVRDGDWVDEGTFDLVDVQLHYQGFVTEQFADRNLPAGDGILYGKWTLGPLRAQGNQVTLDMDAFWFLSEGRGGRPDPRRHEARSTLELTLPEVLELSADRMGSFEVRLTSHATGPGAAGSDYFFTAGMNLPVPTAKLPPDRFLVDGPAPLAGVRGVDTVFEFSASSVSGAPTWFRDQRQTIDYSSDEHAMNLVGSGTIGRGNPWAAMGEPARWLTGHLRDPETVFAMPVYIHLTDSLDPSTPRYTATTYGYALYKAEPGQYTGPLPADLPPEGPGGPDDLFTDDPAGTTPGGEGDRPQGGTPTPVTPVTPAPVTVDPGAAEETAAGDDLVAIGPDRTQPAPNEPGSETPPETPPEPEGDSTAPAPEPGTRATLAVPDLVGRPAAAARAELEGGGLAVAVSVVAEATSAADAFTVVSQEPAAGALATSGMEVRLGITGAFAGDSEAVVPGLFRTPAAEARERVEAAGLVAEVVIGGPADRADDEYLVTEQVPGSGSRVAPGSTVRITINGEYLPEVPDLVGLPESLALERLSARGLQAEVRVVGAAPSAMEARSVQAASPSAGNRVPAGSTVALSLYGEFLDPRCDGLLQQADALRAAGDRGGALRQLQSAVAYGCPGASAAQEAIDAELDRCGVLVRRSNQQVAASDFRGALASLREAQAARCDNPGIGSGIGTLEDRIAREEANARCNRTVQRGIDQRAAGDLSGALTTFRRAQAEGCNNPGLGQTISDLADALRPPPPPEPPPSAPSSSLPPTGIADLCSNACGSWKFYRRIYGGGGASYPGTPEISCHRNNYWHIVEREIREYRCESGYTNCELSESHPIVEKSFNDSGTYTVTYGENGDYWMNFAAEQGKQCRSPAPASGLPPAAGTSAAPSPSAGSGSFNPNTPRQFSCNVGIPSLPLTEGVLSIGNGRVADYMFEPDRVVRGYSCDFEVNGRTHSVIVHFVAAEGADTRQRMAEYCRSDASKTYGDNRAIDIYMNAYEWYAPTEAQMSQRIDAEAVRRMLRFHAQQVIPYAMPCPAPR